MRRSQPRRTSQRAPRPLAAALALGLAALPCAAAETIYVDASAAPGGDGTLWVRAYHDLADGLADAQSGDVVALADGLYLPSGFDPLVSFVVPAGVSVRGGYAGQGAPDPDLRDPASFPSVLSGDLLGNDLPGFLNREDNSRHVLELSGATTWELDGLTVRSGHADGPIFTTHGLGGGLLAAVLGSVTLRGCRFEDNLAFNGGGAVAFLSNTAVLVEDCSFEANRSDHTSGHGGALYQGALTLRDSEFRHNEASLGQGGAVWASSTVLVERCRFESNASRGASSRGGAIVLNLFGIQTARVRECTFVGNLSQPPTGPALGGAISGIDYEVDACRFYGNVADGSTSARGGALYGTYLTVRDSLFSGNLSISDAGTSFGGALSCSELTLLNSTVSRNRALSLGGGVHTISPTLPVLIANSILRGNTAGSGLPLLDQQLSAANFPTLRTNSIHGWDGSLGGLGNTAANPLLVDSDGADGVVGTEDDDLELSPGSPCIDAGEVDSLPLDGADVDCDGQLAELSPVDIDGRVRRHDEPGSPDVGIGPAPLPDMGAHEYRAPLPAERWTDLGGSLAGAFGTPLLAGGGTLCDDSPLELVLTEARPGSTATLVLGLSFLSAPFKGGTLVPDADVLVGGLPTGLGGFTLGLPWPAGLSGLQLIWQVWIADDTGPLGFTASNGVLSEAP